MKTINKNGINWVTDLTWQIVPSRLNHKLYEDECQFDYYCHAKCLPNAYGFGRSENRELNKNTPQAKNMVSLGLFVSYMSNLPLDARVFIIFKFDAKAEQELYGYVLIYDGVIYPDNGEYIGTLDEISAKVLFLRKKYDVEYAYITEDCPLWNNQAYLLQADLIVSEKRAPEGSTLSASDYYYWQAANYKAGINTSRLLTFAARHRNKKTLILVGGVAAFFICVFVILQKFLTTPAMEQVQNVVQQVIPKTFNPQKFIDVCFADFEKYGNPQAANWTLSSFSCDAKGIEYVYVSKDGATLESLSLAINKPNLVFNNNQAKLSFKIKTEALTPIKNSELQIHQIDQLSTLTKKLSITMSQNRDEVMLESKYSPIYLYKMQLLTNLNLVSISANADNDGFFNWHIKGDLNGQK